MPAIISTPALPVAASSPITSLNGGRGGRKLGQTVGNDGFGVALPGVELLGGGPCGQQGDQGAQNKQSCDYLFHGNRC
ncbi:hypothetical protein [Alistipes putredinis]|uniref:hypothetical protein n=1 Tax=Alistipes putredinis TaxID=28117 RepID=UPI003991801F